MIAADWGHAAQVRLLLAAGADVNARANHGYTALSWAKSAGRDTIVRLLKRAGAKE